VESNLSALASDLLDWLPTMPEEEGRPTGTSNLRLHHERLPFSAHVAGPWTPSRTLAEGSWRPGRFAGMISGKSISVPITRFM